MRREVSGRGRNSVMTAGFLLACIGVSALFGGLYDKNE